MVIPTLTKTSLASQLHEELVMMVNGVCFDEKINKVKIGYRDKMFRLL